jgi:hypothetical protein
MKRLAWAIWRHMLRKGPQVEEDQPPSPIGRGVGGEGVRASGPHGATALTPALSRWERGPVASLLFIVAVGSAIMGVGCASNQPNNSASSDAPSVSSQARPNLPSAEVLRERLTGANNGLELRRWTVVDAPDRVMNVLSNHADGAAADQETIDRLKRNGFRFIRVPVSELDALVAELGGATIDRNEWHGQVYDWRALMEQPIDPRGLAVAIDGRVRRFDRGAFRLLIRSWTAQMEDGPRMHLEVLPQHSLPRANDLRRLMGEKPADAGEAFATLALDLQLQAGYAYVLVSESPEADWPELDRPAVVNEALAGVVGDEPAPGAPDGSLPAVRPRDGGWSRMGPPEAIGPEAGAPLTLGEMLLPLSVSPPMRRVLAFVPKIPAELFPPIYESDEAIGRAGDRSGEPSPVARRERDR